MEPRIQKSDRPYPNFSVIFPVVDQEQCSFKIETDRLPKRYSVLPPVDAVLRTVEQNLHRSKCIYN